ncbi:MAG TPA: hypothetical protein VGB55_03315 [Tepidisphaeraceae bacterium]|jgi:uncharacterized protein with PIN domain
MLAETMPLIDNISSLGAAGLIGVMWLWERKQSAQREKQLEDAHTRIMSDGIKLEALMDLVKSSTEAISTMVTQHEQLLRRLDHDSREPK